MNANKIEEILSKPETFREYSKKILDKFHTDITDALVTYINTDYVDKVCNKDKFYRKYILIVKEADQVKEKIKETEENIKKIEEKIRNKKKKFYKIQTGVYDDEK